MSESKPTRSSASDWLPPADLSPSSDPVGNADSQRGSRESPEPERPGESRTLPLIGALVGVTLAVTIGVLVDGGDAGNDTIADEVSVDDQPRGTTPIVGAVGPGKALQLAVAVQARDQQADDSAGIIKSEQGGPIGPTTTTAVRARYIVRLAAVAALLQETGRQANRFRASPGDTSREDAIRAGLDALTAVSTGLDTSVYTRSRELDGLVDSTVSQVTNHLDAGDQRGVQVLGGELSRLGRQITTELERAADAAGEGRTLRAGRAFELVERRLATLERIV